MNPPPFSHGIRASENRARLEFDRWAERGQAEEMASGHRDVTEQALDRAAFGPRDRGLDVGCGNGWAARLMKERGIGWAVGIDISPGMVARARPEGGLGFCIAGAARLPFRSGIFTRVLSVESLYYYPDLDGALREIRRVCVDGGRFLCVVDLFADNPASRCWADVLDVDVHVLSESEYGERFRKAGFRRVETLRLRDRRPLTPPDEFVPDEWCPNYEAYQVYHEAGSLLIDAEA